jgi:UV DNA damage endonuclease
MFSVADLLTLHDMLKPRAPIVFDFHHWRFCTGGMTSEEALRAAMSTWPPGIRPVVHWSESQGGKAAHAHSDYIGQLGRLNLHGLDAEVDVMVESKAKELSILLYRDILKNGNAGREAFFQGIDEIEEEAARVEAARAEGREVELEPLPSVTLEGVEIIPVNDKRLHGRSQRRNKAKVAARASASKLASQQSLSQHSDGEDAAAPTPAKRKRRTKEEIEADKVAKAAAKAAREAAKAEAAAGAAKAAGKQAKPAAKQAKAMAKQAASMAVVEPATPAVKAKTSRAPSKKRLAAAVAAAEEAAAVEEQVGALAARAGAVAEAVAEEPAKKAKGKKAAAGKAVPTAELVEPATPQPAATGKRRRVQAA